MIQAEQDFVQELTGGCLQVKYLVSNCTSLKDDTISDLLTYLLAKVFQIYHVRRTDTL